MRNGNSSLKLTIELVPKTSWYNNVRAVVSPAQWDKIRKASYKNFNFKCGICNAEGRLSCHEIWEYDDEKYIQKLAGFIALCTNCHNIKHIGLSQILANEGKLDFEKLIEHFCKINECSIEKFDESVEMAFFVWNERSKHDWTVDFGDYSNIVNKKLDAK
jgi:hypothetical protein